MKSEILLIDDEKDIRFAVHEILKENNFFVREADTVEKAFSEIKKKFRNVSKQFAAYHKSSGTKENVSKSDDTDYGILELSNCKHDKANYDSFKKDESIEHSLEFNNSINFKGKFKRLEF